MKQGSGHNSMGGRKREPISHAVNPAGVAQLGSAMGNHATDSTKVLRNVSAPMYEGRGYEAPKGGMTVHHGGSQGKHE